MALGQTGLALLVAAFAVEACGGDSKKKPAVIVGSGSGGSHQPVGGSAGDSGEGGMGATAAEGGMGASTATGGTAGSGVSDPGAPVVEITSPVAVKKPNDEGVIVDGEIDVVCKVSPASKSSATIDTVTIEMQDAANEVIESYPATSTGTNEYTAHFITRKVTDNGRISFVCYGSDTDTRASTDRIDSFIDHGPKITALAPVPPPDEMTVPFATAVGTPLEVRFKVEEAPIADGDDGAQIGDVSLTVAGEAFDLMEDGGEYSATVHLNDPTKFANVLDGLQRIVIDAANKRQPAPASSEVAYNFLVDGEGPVIKIETPVEGDVLHGNVLLTFTVEDAGAGVDPSSVVVTLDKKEYPFDDADVAWQYDGGTEFTFSFDTTQIKTSVAQVTINLDASDLVGNVAEDVVLKFSLDNVPPFVELDPLPVRETDLASGTCSLAFDPVGSKAAKDLDHIFDFKIFRTFVWDETNHATGDHNGDASETDEGSVLLFVQPKPEQGLLIDTTKDGVCDAIQDKDTETGDDLIPISLVPIPPMGTSWFGLPGNEDAKLAALNPMPDGCMYGTSDTAPMPLCTPPLSDLTRVIHWDIQGTKPAIFGVPDLTPDRCTGYGWEIGAVVKEITEGWICVAAQASDNNGNVGISPPLRLCYDNGEDPPADCSGPPPSCRVNDCTLKPRFGPAVLIP
jgi:hypothetical protein